MKRFLWGAALLLLILLVGFQFVPYGRNLENPPVRDEPGWDDPQTRVLFMRACGDCHSNETDWPWYSGVAPASWLLQYDVEEGREHFNVSEWGRGEQDADEAAETVREGEMPLWYYLPLHAEARLTAAEEAALIRGLEATFGSESDEGAAEGEEHGEEESHQ